MTGDEADRTMTIERVIAAPVTRVWQVWWDPQTLPLWWGPDGFSCRTNRIDLRDGGEWVFDMIGPDGTVYPNHHLYHDIEPMARIRYRLLMGENGPLHALATATFTDLGRDGTKVTLTMVMNSVADCEGAKAFGAEALGLQTLGKLAQLAAQG